MIALPSIGRAFFLRSNAKAYFKRWVRKNFPCYEDYDFTVYRYSSMYDMLHDEYQISSYELVIVD